MSDKTVQLLLTADDQASAVLKSLSGTAEGVGKKIADDDEANTGKRIGLIEKFKQNYLAATAAIAAAVVVIGQAWGAALEGAQILQQRTAFENLSATYGTTADSLVGSLKRVSEGALSTKDIINSASKAMLLGIPAKELENLLKIAVAASKATGDTVTKSFDDIVTGTARQSKLILDNLGIIVDIEKANEQYATSVGKLAKDLTDAEKKQAFFNAVMAAGQTIIENTGNATGGTALRVQQLQAKLGDLAEGIKVGLLGVLGLVVGGFEAVAAGANAAFFMLIETFAELSGLVGADELAATLHASAAAAKKAAFEMKAASDKDLANGWNVLSGNIENTALAAKKNATAIGEVTAAAALSAEETQKLGEETANFGSELFKVAVEEKKVADEEKKLTAEREKAAAAIDKQRQEAAKLALEFEKIASNERIKKIEMVIDFKTAQVEADTKRIQAAFESTSKSVESTGQTIVGLANALSKMDGVSVGSKFIQEALKREQDMQAGLIQSTIDYNKVQTDLVKLKLEAMRRGDALIKIDGAGLQPHLEAFMFEILHAIQIRVSGEGGDLLLGYDGV
jgi:hypothetical protein